MDASCWRRQPWGVGSRFFKLCGSSQIHCNRGRQEGIALFLRSAPPHTGSPGPFGPGTPEESEKSPERVPRGRAPKVPKECAPKSQKSLKRVRKSGFTLFSDSFETPGRTLWAFLGTCPGVLFPDSFRTLPGFRARRARETLCGAGPIATLFSFSPVAPLSSCGHIFWDSTKVSHKRVFALLTPEIRGWKMAQMLQKKPCSRSRAVNGRAWYPFVWYFGAGWFLMILIFVLATVRAKIITKVILKKGRAR